jgi:hypothetical protein
VLNLQSALVLFLLVYSSDLVRLVAWGKFDLGMIFGKRTHGLTFRLIFDMRDISNV